MLARLFGRKAPPSPAAAPQLSSPFFDRYPAEGLPVPGATPADIERCERWLGSLLPASLKRYLSIHNGGFRAGGLIHLMGASRPLRHDDLATWNQPFDWKATFADLDLQRFIFFADDVFGNQFGYVVGEAEPAVWRLDVQMGELSEMAPSISAFFDELLVEEGPWLLGSDYLDAYREAGSAWRPGQHLSPVIPCLLGGGLDPENLRPMDPSSNLHIAGQLVTQVKPLPSGTEIRGFRVDQATRTVFMDIASAVRTC